MRRSRRSVFASVLLALGMTAVATPALAEPPVDFGSGYVVDTVDVLSDADERRLSDALDRLAEQEGIVLLVAYVDEFEAPSDWDAWLDDTFVINRLGQSNVLLAIAVESRDFGVYVHNDGPLTDDQLARVEQDYLIPELRNDRWLAGGIAYAQGLQDVLGGTSGPIDPGPSTPATPGNDSGVPGWLWLLIFVVPPIGLIILAARKKGSPSNAAPEGLSQKELDGRVGSALVAVDDALRSSEQELGFAEAQFGTAAVREFTTALTTAREKVQRAFTLKQQLDDEIEDSPQDRRAWSLEILELTAAASKELEAQAESFEQLRKLEVNVAPALADLQKNITSLSGASVEAQAALTALQQRYSPAALNTVAQNPQQIAALVQFATEQAAQAESDIAAEQRSNAAIAVRAGQRAVAQAEALLASVGTLGKDLDQATAALPKATAQLQASIAEAQALSQQQALDSAAVGAIAAAEAALRTASTQGNGNPLSTLSDVEAQLAALNPVVQAGRTAAERKRQLQESLSRALITAQSQVRSAEDFIGTRRGGVGATARTRLSEAQRHLALAQASSGDPERALQEAKTAGQLAETAVRLANNDFSGYGNQGSQTSLSDLLGGMILGDILSGNNRGSYSPPRRSSGSGWFSGGSSSSSSSYRRSSGGFGGSSRSSGGRSSGGFGGGGRSSGGGGGRSRGGRF